MTFHPKGRALSEGTDSERLVGDVVRLSFSNPENGHTVAVVQTERQLVTAVGKMPAIQPGASATLLGQWKTHPVYGPQFVVSHLTVSQPATLEAMQRYLGSGLVPALGPVLAERLVKYFGLAVLDILDQSPHRVAEVAGIGKKRQEWLKQAWAEHRVLREQQSHYFSVR